MALALEKAGSVRRQRTSAVPPRRTTPPVTSTRGGCVSPAPDAVTNALRQTFARESPARAVRSDQDAPSALT